MLISTIRQRLVIYPNIKLELFPQVRCSSSSQEGPTLYAFAHSLNSTIAFLRAKLMQSSPFVYDDENYNDSLAACWLQFTPYDDVLKALTSMCDRVQHSTLLSKYNL